MTNYLTKLLSAFSVAGLMLVTPAAAECSFPFDAYKTEVEKKTAEGELNLQIVTVEPSQVKNFIAQAGDPPGVDMAKPYEGYLVVSATGLAMMLFVQDGCVVTTAGPIPVEAFLQAFGLVDASSIEYNASVA